MEQEYNLLSILKMLGKWKKHILIATLSTIVMTAVASMFLPDYYMSEAVFYASNPAIAEPEPLDGNEKENKGIYGNDDDVDRLLAIAESSAVRSTLIKHYNLAKHYDIDISTGKGIEKLHKKFQKLYSVSQNQYGAITLSIEDTNPQIAKDMVTTARFTIDTIAKNLIEGSQSNQLVSKKGFVNTQSKLLADLNERIKTIKSKYNIYNIEYQGEAFAEMQSQINPDLEGQIAKLNVLKSIGASKARINATKVEIETLKKRKANLDKAISKFNEGALELNQLEDEFETMNTEAIYEKERLKKLQSSNVKNYKATILVEEEYVPVVKSRPKRTFIVIGIGFIAFILSSLIAVFIESTKTVNWKEIYAGE